MKVFKFYAEQIVIAETEEEARDIFADDYSIYFCENADCEEIDNPREYGLCELDFEKAEKESRKHQKVVKLEETDNKLKHELEKQNTYDE